MSRFSGNDTAQQLEDFIDAMLTELHTAKPGEIVSVSKVGGQLVASVRPSVDQTLANGDTLSAPVIDNVPVHRMASAVAGGNAMLLLPVMPGDGCLLVASDRSLDGWQAGSRTEGDPRHHDLSDVVAIVGLNRPGTVAEPDNENLWLSFAGGSICITPAGDIAVTATTEVRINAQTLTVDAAQTTFTGEVTVERLLTFNGGLSGRAGEGTTAEIQGTINVTGGDVLIDGISSKGHRHDNPEGGQVGPPE